MLKKLYGEVARLASYLQSIALFLARLAVAYGFYEPAMMKWSDIGAVADWFGSMGFPLPLLNAYAAASTEALGVVLLTLGLFTRAISIPLIVVMIVAITTVHLPNGFSAGDNDAQILFWAPDEDIKTALETIEERCLMAFDGIPGETRKSFEDGTTIFERVLPGADRMYPDTDSAPIPLTSEYIETLRKGLPSEVIDRYKEFKDAGVAEDCFTYIFSKDLYSLIVRISEELGYAKNVVGNFFGQIMKFVENKYSTADEFNYHQVYDLFRFMKEKELEIDIAKPLLVELYQHPKIDFDSILNIIGFKHKTKEEIVNQIPFLEQKFDEIKRKDTPDNRVNWIMGQLRQTALGNINLAELQNIIKA